jgi:hypothetical protein
VNFRKGVRFFQKIFQFRNDSGGKGGIEEATLLLAIDFQLRRHDLYPSWALAKLPIFP